MESQVFTKFTDAFLYLQEHAAEKPVIMFTSDEAYYVVGATKSQAANAYFSHVCAPLIPLDRDTLSRKVCDALRESSRKEPVA